MTAKTYGEILLDEMEKGTEFERLSLASEATFERCARAVLLEFIRRVEERMGEIDGKPQMHLTRSETLNIALGRAFDQLSDEIKEAK